jgi:hypothetical protein
MGRRASRSAPRNRAVSIKKTQAETEPPDAARPRDRLAALRRKVIDHQHIFDCREWLPWFAPERATGDYLGKLCSHRCWNCCWRKPTDWLFPAQYLAGTRSHCAPVRSS